MCEIISDHMINQKTIQDKVRTERRYHGRGQRRGLINNMKAKEYAKRYSESQDKNECLFQIVRDILLESEEIAKQRNIKRGSALFSVFDELSKKWKAFVRLTNDPTIRPDGFERYFEKQMPETYQLWKNSKLPYPPGSRYGLVRRDNLRQKIEQ